MHGAVHVSFTCRWKRDSDGGKVEKDGLPVAQFIAVQRRDNKEWALPGVSAFFLMW